MYSHWESKIKYPADAAGAAARGKSKTGSVGRGHGNDPRGRRSRHPQLRAPGLPAIRPPALN